jgi:hypothetical protein
VFRGNLAWCVLEAAPVQSSFTIHLLPSIRWNKSCDLNEQSLRPFGSMHRIPGATRFQTTRFRLTFAMGLQFARQCWAPVRLCFFYNLQAKLGWKKSKVRYFWRIYLN